VVTTVAIRYRARRSCPERGAAEYALQVRPIGVVGIGHLRQELDAHLDVPRAAATASQATAWRHVLRSGIAENPEVAGRIKELEEVVEGAAEDQERWVDGVRTLPIEMQAAISDLVYNLMDVSSVATKPLDR
jgi:hypothetical protein